MKVSDNAIARLRAAVESPDLEGSRYHLLDKLGQGGMGGVYRVEDSILGRQVAMKVVAVPDSTSSLADRLLREAQIIARLEHPGIVPVHDVGTLPDGRVFYTMKLVQGKRLDAHAAELGTIPERLRLVQKVCDAVGFAHARGVLHRDLKPQNVMVGPFGEVLVMDWGLSKIIREQEATRPSDSSPILSPFLSRMAPRTARFLEPQVTCRQNKSVATTLPSTNAPTFSLWALSFNFSPETSLTVPIPSPGPVL